MELGIPSGYDEWPLVSDSEHTDLDPEIPPSDIPGESFNIIEPKQSVAPVVDQ